MPLSPDLTRFVKDSLERGIPRPQIEQALLKADWPRDQVAQAINGFADVEFPIPVPRPASYVSARDAFMYVVMFGTLIVSAYSLGNLLFELINRALPDPADQSFPRSTLEAIRWSLSALIVAFPVFLYVSAMMARMISREPTKRASRERRNLTYLTLFLAGCVLIGDVIAVVYNFLGGELTLRFLLKVLTVGAIAGTIFGYYYFDLRDDENQPET